MSRLTDRASLKRALFTLCDTDATDADLIEHDASTLEGVYRLLTEAGDTAQEELIRGGYGEFWLETSAAISWSGSDATLGGRYWALPAEFRRAYGDENDSCLREADGSQWGQEIPPELRLRAEGNFYYFRSSQLWIAREADPPATLYMDYYRKVQDMQDSVDVDFPEELRSLVVAYAAVDAASEAWYTGDREDVQRLGANLERKKKRAFAMLRPSRKRRTIRPKAMHGNTHWWS